MWHTIVVWWLIALHFRTNWLRHYSDVIIGAIAYQITSLTIDNSTIYLGADHRKHQGSVSLAYVRGIHRWPANSSHKWPVTRKMFPFDDVIMEYCNGQGTPRSFEFGHRCDEDIWYSTTDIISNRKLKRTNAADIFLKNLNFDTHQHEPQRCIWAVLRLRWHIFRWLGLFYWCKAWIIVST